MSLLLLFLHFHNMLYIVIHLLDNSYNLLIHLSLNFHIYSYLHSLHIYLINLLNMFYSLLLRLFFHFRNLVSLHRILYTSLYISHPFRYLINYHILLMLPDLLLNLHISYSYTSSRLLYSYYMFLLPLSFSFHNMLYIVIRP